MALTATRNAPSKIPEGSLADTMAGTDDDATITVSEYEDNTFMSKKLLAAIIRGIRLGSWCRTHPIYWNTALNKFEYRRDLFSKLIWTFNSCLTYLNYAFVIVRAVQTSNSTEADIGTRIVMGFYVVNYTLPATCLTAFIFFGGDEIADSLNQSLKLFQAFSEHMLTILPDSRRLIQVRFSELFVELGLYVAIFVVATQTTVNVFKPSLEIFPSSLFYDPSEHVLPIVPWMISSVATGILCYLYIGLTHVYLICAIPARLPYQALIGALARSDHHRCQNAALLYRQLFLNNEQYNRVAGTFALPVCQLMLIGLCIAGIVAAVRFHNMEGFLMASCFPINYGILVVLLRVLANTDRKCKKLKARWSRDLIVDLRTMKTLKPIRATFGSFCYADTGLVLTATEIIISNAINLLLVT